jgi:hypothetical protein
VSVPYEKTLEAYLCKKVKSLGGKCLKLTGEAGIPDRLVILPGGRYIFVELKREGEKPRPIQDFRIQQLMYLGCNVLIIDSEEDIRRELYYEIHSSRLPKEVHICNNEEE